MAPAGRALGQEPTEATELGCGRAQVTGKASNRLQDLCSNFWSPSVLCVGYKVTSTNCPGLWPASC